MGALIPQIVCKDADYPRSYIKYLVDEWTGLDVPAEVVNTGGGILFFGALVLSIYLNIQDRIKNN